MRNLKKKYCIIIGLGFALTGLILSKTYRSYIYSHQINDFHIADTLGNIVAVPAALFFLSGIRKTKISICYSIPLIVLAYILFEFGSLIGLHGTFDTLDIIANISSGMITYLMLRFVFKAKEL